MSGSLLYSGVSRQFKYFILDITFHMTLVYGAPVFNCLANDPSIGPPYTHGTCISNIYGTFKLSIWSLLLEMFLCGLLHVVQIHCGW